MTDYFILTKIKSNYVNNDHDNEIVHLKNKQTFILPAINLDYYNKHGLFEKNLIEWCKQFCKKDKLFLDIGAHTGTYSISLANLCKEVHAFEPQRMTYYGLCGSIVLSNISNIQAHQYGLGCKEQEGIQTLNIVSLDGGGSSIQTLNNVLSTELVTIKLLDNLNLNDIGFIKMDVEDNELFVLMGGKETIKKSGYPPILFESNNENNLLFDYLNTEFNYRIIRVTGVNNMFLATTTSD